MTYEQAVAYIDEIPKFTIKHPLAHTREFVKRLGNPSMERKIIHVAGTNGKGSVCAYLQGILMALGKRTALFTSPHLVKVNERIKVNGVQISDEDFLHIFNIVKENAVAMEEEGMGHPSYFEFLFGMGMLAFEEADVEYIILETGLGGRLDATNSVERPVASLITSISLDHTAILGDTIEEIAYEKAGIIKEGVPVFCDGTEKRAVAVFEKTAQEKNTSLCVVDGEDFEIKTVKRDSITFTRKNAYGKITDTKVPLCGFYQVMNAMLAIRAAEYLYMQDTFETGERFSDAEFEMLVNDAVAGIRWEGRMEQVSPYLTIDGAHNPGAIEAFIKSVRLLGEKEEPVIIFSAVSDKKYEQMIKNLCENVPAKGYVVTEIEDKRRVTASELSEIFRRYTDRPVYCQKELSAALEKAMEIRDGESMVYCLGSLYLVGMVKRWIEGGHDHA
ncbi:MAG: bifunctional folylpolyglutamate synthase/dihydrofolate synthase [Dorea sp.]|nr:bifunctional folylpolyglutamate synthase/dihydrofolate synthase [Dorea sp.]